MIPSAQSSASLSTLPSAICRRRQDSRRSTEKEIANSSVSDLPLFRRRISLRVVKCGSVESGLYPKPRRKPAPATTGELDTEQKLATRSSKENWGICLQIEKLVFFKRYHEALELFEIVRARVCGDHAVGRSTYDALVSACIGAGSSRDAKLLFHHMLETSFEFDQYIRNRVLLMHNPISFNIMISGLVDAGDHEEAFKLFLLLWEELSDASSRTFASALRAVAGLGRAFSGRQLHACIIKMGLPADIFISCALIDMYSKCGSIAEAHWVFDEMPEKTVVGWNTIIAGYALHGYSEEALDVYYEMRRSGVKMDHFTYSIIIRICARLASLEHAKQAHAGLVRTGLAWIFKWGRMEDARNLFDKMPRRNLISWNALIGGYANHGQGKEAVAMFEQMLRADMAPNHVTYLAVLSACGYSGLSAEGWEIFELMTLKHKIKPRAMHYACMIELLGRDGLLDDALSLIRGAPFAPTANMWAALLTACRIHKNLELGKLAAEKLYGMEPEKLSNYVVLLNIYYRSGRSDEAAKVLETLKRKGLSLHPASSWIEIKKQPYRFLFADKSHPQRDEIYGRLDELMVQIAAMGYSQEEKSSLLPDVGEHEEHLPRYHSEKLAVVYGLMSTPEGTSLQVVQGHRICSDCHGVIKLISRITGRHIVVRDASRFHHFKQGSCSCGDYW
ncbi:unnamed protein product [Spirodela intermedia]|uniref:DYW domain-containing protein n=1 Tax=Spirodela intermedia TaxID=51605 RepID=A0A7I8IMY9_SPIIN|nr:unnamed protein product [Spirodela intermedia]CAA6658324.1 unnamed protein product [Spirodela intermedia]